MTKKKLTDFLKLNLVASNLKCFLFYDCFPWNFFNLVHISLKICTSNLSVFFIPQIISIHKKQKTFSPNLEEKKNIVFFFWLARKLAPRAPWRARAKKSLNLFPSQIFDIENTQARTVIVFVRSSWGVYAPARSKKLPPNPKNNKKKKISAYYFLHGPYPT